MAATSPKMSSTKRAVVDIGSNSVRLVIFDGSRRAPASICNEKALCGLGRDMTASGALNSASVEFALATLQRFRRLLGEHGDPPTRAIATAAVREASDGRAFVKQVQKLGFDVEVIDGEKEAELAALGVISYHPAAEGLVGDMGGGSLELAFVKERKIKDRSSLSIGPLRLMQDTGNNLDKAKSVISREIDSLSWVKPKKFDTLYAVGGAWRAVARIHMRLRSYPLSILHGYEMSQGDAIEMCDLVARQSRRSLEEIPGIPRRRIDTLPYAALVLKAVLKRMNAEKVFVSAGGVREGLLYDQLTDEEKKIDPLLAGAGFYAERLSPALAFGEAVSAMTAPMFPDETPAQRQLREATCLMIDTGAYFHPDLRGEHVFDTALRAPFYAISHEGRAAMALALFVRHEGRRAAFPDDQAMGLLSWEDQQAAIRLGLAMRFAGALAPKAPSLLRDCRLSLEEGALVFRAPADVGALMEEFPRRRLQSLASAFEVEPVERYANE
ncbi:MAG: Ppx/GppA family phosphatase [Pseudomonadota bacterium]